MDIISLYQEHGIEYRTDNHKHTRDGWVNIECPFCTGNPGYHLGYNLDNDFFVCWRCGSHSVYHTLKALIPTKDPNTLTQIYGGVYHGRTKKEPKVNLKPFKFPSNTGDFEKKHISYLERRGYDPEKLINSYQLQGTGILSKLDDINYKSRIVIPVMWEGRIISFISRDVTGKHPLKYLACPEEREIINHKTVLYGANKVKSDSCFVVEGTTDVWRLYENSVATFGIKYKHAQLRQLKKLGKKLIIAYDPDPQAIIQARKLTADLQFRGVDVINISEELDCDPGDLSQKEADYMMKHYL
jgi:hypothetical protein